MKKITLALLAIASLALFGWEATPAQAQGLHVRTGGLHLDFGRVSHGYYGVQSGGYGIRAGGCVVPAPIYPAPYRRRAPHVVRHGNHLHAGHGRYDVYRSYERYRPSHRGRGRHHRPHHPYR